MNASRPIRPLAAGILGVAVGVLATTAWATFFERTDLRASDRFEAWAAPTSLAESLDPGSADPSGPASPPGHPTCPYARSSSSSREVGSLPRCPALRDLHGTDDAHRSSAPAQPGIVPGSIGEAAKATTVL